MTPQDLYEIARYVGVAGDAILRLKGLLEMLSPSSPAGRYVLVPRQQIERAKLLNESDNLDDRCEMESLFDDWLSTPSTTEGDHGHV